MKLTIIERITLLGALPTEGNVVTLKIVRKLREALSFTEEELKTFGIEVQGERITWNVTVEPPDGVEIPVGEKATDIASAALQKLNAANKLTEQHLSLCEKFNIS